jgi:hypothetical protein
MNFFVNKINDEISGCEISRVHALHSRVTRNRCSARTRHCKTPVFIRYFADFPSTSGMDVAKPLAQLGCENLDCKQSWGCRDEILTAESTGIHLCNLTSNL